MHNKHMQPIITNARQGRAISTANRPRRRRLNLHAIALLAALAAFWIVAGFLVTLAR